MQQASVCVALALAWIAAVPSHAHSIACPHIEVVYEPTVTQINSSMAPDNKYGLEDGIVVRRKDGCFSMISAEMYSDPKGVNMRLGIWRSTDALMP